MEYLEHQYKPPRIITPGELARVRTVRRKQRLSTLQLAVILVLIAITPVVITDYLEARQHEAQAKAAYITGAKGE